jgi:dipeptidase
MGDLVEEYGWYGSGEIINVTDGEEVWICEFYGRDLWIA